MNKKYDSTTNGTGSVNGFIDAYVIPMEHLI